MEKEKKKSVLKYISWKNLSEEINAYGFNYSFRRFMLMCIIVLGVGIFSGWFYRLEWYFTIIVCIAAMICLPIIIHAQFKFLYRQRVFSDLDNYLHQMIYSFQRSGKIILALEDTEKIATPELQIHVRKALNILKNSYNTSVYEEALAVIEDAYPCTRIKTLHKFLISVEKNGGHFSTSLNVILRDVDRWVKRVYKNQEELRVFKNMTGIGCIICFVVGATTILITAVLGADAELGMSMDISGNLIYQVVSILFLLGILLFYTVVINHITGEWMDVVRPNEIIERDYNIVFTDTANKLAVKMLPVSILVVVASVVCMLLIKDWIVYVFGVTFILFGASLPIVPFTTKASAKSRLIQDVYSGFSDWLRDIAINLQLSPLIAAISDTYDTAPYIIRRSLNTFISEISENPSDVTPYHRFLSEYKNLDISTSVKMLYSLSDIDVDKIDEAVNDLVERNYEMLEKYAELKSMSAKSKRDFSNYIPVGLMAVKISVDMLVMVMVLI